MKIKDHNRQQDIRSDVEAAEPETPRRCKRRGPMVGPPPVHVPASAPPPPTPEPRRSTKKRFAAARFRASWCGWRRKWGRRCRPGDILLVLEAMKMETNITAPVAGKIAAVKVKQGDSVQAGQVVVEFE